MEAVTEGGGPTAQTIDHEPTRLNPMVVESQTRKNKMKSMHTFTERVKSGPWAFERREVDVDDTFEKSGLIRWMIRARRAVHAQ